MTGREVTEGHRAANTLELLFDLVMVVAVGTASSGLHHALVHGQIFFGITTYCFCFFSIWLAWWNFTWFASAFDTDDTRYRITVFFLMVGAIIMAVGQREMFKEDGSMTLGVVGYVIMRLSMVSQWLRASREDPSFRYTCRTYALGIAIAQVFWCLLLLVPRGAGVYNFLALGIMLLELAIPFVAESHGRIPWHPHHIAERHGLLVIIVLGEGVLGSINATGLIDRSGTLSEWLLPVLLVCICTAALTFALWWHYFHIPFGEILERNRATAVPFGYLHYFIFASLAAVGAGFEILADAISKGWERNLLITSGVTVLTALAVYFVTIGIMRSLIFNRLKG